MNHITSFNYIVCDILFSILIYMHLISYEMKVCTTFTPRKNNSNRFCCVYECTSLARRNLEIKFVTFLKFDNRKGLQ